jgi:Ser/Thr protein kinase RdoA (MazF antagonist)
VRWLETELDVYRVFAGLDGVPLQKLVEIVEDRTLSYYQFGVVTRMPGVIFSSVELDLEPEGYERVLRELGELTAVWHDVPLDTLPETIKPKVFDDTWEEADFYRWMYPALSPETVDEAWQEICGLTARLVYDFDDTAFGLLVTDESRAKWRAVLAELANLPPVLVHGDVHEDQFFVRSRSDLTVTGVIDWGTAAIGNPVFDFNFGEWGVDLWRYRDYFGQFRRVMWQDYLRARNLRLSTSEGLHLFYTLQELYCAAKREKPSIVYDTIEEERRAVLERLVDVTERIPSVSSL